MCERGANSNLEMCEPAADSNLRLTEPGAEFDLWMAAAIAEFELRMSEQLVCQWWLQFAGNWEFANSGAPLTLPEPLASYLKAISVTGTAHAFSAA